MPRGTAAGSPRLLRLAAMNQAPAGDPHPPAPPPFDDPPASAPTEAVATLPNEATPVAAAETQPTRSGNGPWVALLIGLALLLLGCAVLALVAGQATAAGA